jgi:hypothetical protein
MTVLPLDPIDAVPPHATKAVLRVRENCEWVFAWDAFREVALDVFWWMECWVISAVDVDELPVFEPGHHIVVRKFSSDWLLIWRGKIHHRALKDEDKLLPICDVPDDEENDDEGDAEYAGEESKSESSDPDVGSDVEREPYPVPADDPPPGVPEPDSVPPPVDAAVVAVAAAVGRGGAKGRGRGRGWAARGGRRLPYVFFEVGDEIDSTHVLGRIKINIASASLDVTCDRCGGGFDRKFLPRAGVRRCNQGRPMGSHLRWLHSPCDGDPILHKALWNDNDMPHDERLAKRNWGVAVGIYDELFDLERPCFDGEDEEPLHVA